MGARSDVFRPPRALTWSAVEHVFLCFCVKEVEIIKVERFFSYDFPQPHTHLWRMGTSNTDAIFAFPSRNGMQRFTRLVVYLRKCFFFLAETLNTAASDCFGMPSLMWVGNVNIFSFNSKTQFGCYASQSILQQQPQRSHVKSGVRHVQLGWTGFPGEIIFARLRRISACVRSLGINLSMNGVNLWEKVTNLIISGSSVHVATRVRWRFACD